MKYIQIILLILIVNSCAKKQEKAISGYKLSEKKMVAILTDLALAEGNDKVLKKYNVYNPFLLDSTYKLIYKKHDIEAWEMDSSFKTYSTHTDQLKSIFEKVTENLNRLEKK